MQIEQVQRFKKKKKKKSTIGISIFVEGNLVAWKSKKLNVVSHYRAEPKYKIIANFACNYVDPHLMLKVGNKQCWQNYGLTTKMTFISPITLYFMNKPNISRYISIPFIHKKLKKNQIPTQIPN